MELRDLKQFELDRVVNLFRALGFTPTSSEFKDEKIVVSFEKVVLGMAGDIKKIESDRVSVMLRSLDWIPVKAEYPENKIVVVYEKVVTGEVSRV